MFFTNSMIQAIQEKATADQLFKECHHQVILLRNKIRALKKVADEKVSEELRKNPLFQKVANLSADLRKITKSIQSIYSHWSYIYSDGCEGWDCDFYDEELAKLLKPMEEIINKSHVQSCNLENKLIEPIRKKYYTDINALEESLSKLEGEEKMLQQLSQDHDDLMREALKPALGLHLMLINECFAEVGKKDPKRQPVAITAKAIGEKDWQLTLEYEELFDYSGNIDVDNFDKDADEIRDGLDFYITSVNDALFACCEKSIPGIDDIIIDYDDVEIDGNKYHNKGYYEYDTGCGEPTGDYYYGKVTASTNAHIFVIIK